MSIGNPSTLPIQSITPTGDEIEIIKGQGETTFNFDDVLSLELIRKHTKTEDVPYVSNEQLSLYRSSAIEAAEHYTGMYLHAQKTFTESVSRKPFKRKTHGEYKHTLKYPSADGIVHLFGSKFRSDNRQLAAEIGSREVMIPIQHGGIDLSNCCNPCESDNHLNFGLKVMYRAGYGSCEQIPAGIILGCLKHIAWNVENPGDVIQTINNRSATNETGIVGSNNVALSSGALEMWRQYDPEAY